MVVRVSAQRRLRVQGAGKGTGDARIEMESATTFSISLIDGLDWLPPGDCCLYLTSTPYLSFPAFPAIANFSILKSYIYVFTFFF